MARKNLAATACTPVINIYSNGNTICSGASVTFTSALANAGTDSTYQWKKNGVAITGATMGSFTLSDLKTNDIITCEYSCTSTCNAAATVQSNAITINVADDITPVIIVGNSDPLICEGELTVFTTQASYGNATPVYSWKVNDEPVGGNSPTYTTSSLVNGAKVECTLTITTPGCPGPPKSSTSQMNIYVYPMIHPAITITPDRPTVCRGETINFTATANGGAFPAFTWLINGVATGPDAPALSTAALKDGDTISCIITIDQDSRCHTTTSAPSNDVIIHIKDYTNPTFSINAADLDVCKGSPITFTTSAENAGDYKSYQWFINGAATRSNSSVFTSNEYNNGDKVSCVFTTNIPGCAINATITSDTETVTVRDAPVISFKQPEIKILTGESAQLEGIITGNYSSVLWSPSNAVMQPQSIVTATVPLDHDTTFMLTAQDPNGCTASNNLHVIVLRRLFMPAAFTPNKDGRNDVFRIPADASILLHSFSIINRWGNVIFKTSVLGDGWDGTYLGKELESGTYIYLIKGVVNDKEVTIKGTVILLR